MELYNMLVNHGHTCMVGYGRGIASEKVCSIRIGNDFDKYAHALMTRLTDKTGFYSRRASEKLAAQIEQYQPDLIHLHNLHGYYIHVGILFEYLKQKDLPIVWTFHDCWPFTGHCPHFTYAGCDKWKEHCYKCPQKKEYPKSCLWDHSQWNYFHKKQLFLGIKNMQLAVPSHWLAHKVQCSFLNEYPVRVVYNGIDLDQFQESQSPLGEDKKLRDKKIILGVANVWDDRKGLRDFYQLSGQLSDEYQIVLIGLSRKQMRNLPGSIIGIERTNHVQELAGWYSAADVYVNLSYEETFGMTSIEALACGTPVIAYDRTAIAEPIDRSCGMVLKGQGINGLADAVKELTSRKKDREACRKHAEKYKVSNMTKQYLDIYESML